MDRATAWKGCQAALASLDEGADENAVEKDNQDERALVTYYVGVEYAELGDQEGISQIGAIVDAFAAFAQYDESYIDDTAATFDKKFADGVAPNIGERTVKYVTVKIDKLVAWTAADSVWHNDTAQA